MAGYPKPFPNTPRGNSANHRIKAEMKTVLQLAVVVTVSLVGLTAAFGQTLRCEIESKFMCSAESGCQLNKLGVYNVIDLGRLTIARCDAQGCDTYPAGIFQSGATVNISVADRGMLVKLVPSTGAFVEVVTLVGQIYASFGRCRQEH